MSETQEPEPERCGVTVRRDGEETTCGVETHGRGVTLSVDPELAPGVEILGPVRIPLCDEHHAALAAGGTDGLSLG